MLYRLLVSVLFLFSAGIVMSQSPARKTSASPYKERTQGYSDFSNGVHFVSGPEIEAFTELAVFFENKELFQSGHRKAVDIVFSEVGSVPHTPSNALESYRIIMNSRRIDIEYTTPRAAVLAVKELKCIYEDHAGSNARKKRIPCYQVRGWITNEEMTVFRWTIPGSAVPLETTSIEMMLTDPVSGWFGAFGVLEPVGYGKSLHVASSATYAEVEQERRKLVATGLAVLPVFNLTGKNKPFEEITGHQMLSVEGMRFIQILLEAYFRYSGTSSVAFVVPEGRYRDQIRGIVAQYPRVTNLRFLNE